MFVPNLPVVPADPSFFGFAGLSNFEQFNAGSGAYAASQFDVEPPDPGLCAGNGYVVEAVNGAVTVYNSLGIPLTAPTALTQLFHVPPEDRLPEYPPPFINDPLQVSPRCLFDRDTQRWLLIEEDAVSMQTGLEENNSALLLALSHSADPTAGYSVYSIDTTNDGTYCPCYGTQPQLGADANGFYISVDSIEGYEIDVEPSLNGPQFYAFSKLALAQRHPPPIVHIDVGADIPVPPQDQSSPYPGYVRWGGVQPAVSPDTSAGPQTNNGTEYFMSCLNFTRSTDNRIAIWALTDTASLTAAAPSLRLQDVVLNSESYTYLPDALVQKPGPAPLAASLRLPLEAIHPGGTNVMSQVVFSRGRLWSALTTGLGTNVGVAFFSVAPAFDRSGSFAPTLARQGYVAVAGQNVMSPAIGASVNGTPLLAATLSGPNYFPSAVYVTSDGRVHIAGPGSGPDDGISGYWFGQGGFTSGSGIWSAFSTAAADSDGSIWFASEYIGGKRTVLANWGTFIGHIRLPGGK